MQTLLCVSFSGMEATRIGACGVMGFHRAQEGALVSRGWTQLGSFSKCPSSRAERPLRTRRATRGVLSNWGALLLGLPGWNWQLMKFLMLCAFWLTQNTSTSCAWKNWLPFSPIFTTKRQGYLSYLACCVNSHHCSTPLANNDFFACPGLRCI